MIPTCPRCGYSEPDCRALLDHHLCGEPTPPAPTLRDLAESFVREAETYDVRAAGHRMRWWAAEFGLALSRTAAPASPAPSAPAIPSHIQTVAASFDLVRAINDRYAQGPTRWVIYFRSPEGAEARCFADLSPFPGVRPSPAPSEEAPALCRSCRNPGCMGDVDAADRARCKTLAGAPSSEAGPAPSEEAPDDFEETFELDRHPLRAPSSEAGTRGDCGNCGCDHSEHHPLAGGCTRCGCERFSARPRREGGET